MIHFRSPLTWLFLASLLLVAGCAEKAASGAADTKSVAEAKGSGNPHLIRIVSSLPRTGSGRQQTDTIVNGIQMALDEAHDQVDDFQIEYQDLRRRHGLGRRMDAGIGNEQRQCRGR